MRFNRSLCFFSNKMKVFLRICMAKVRRITLLLISCKTRFLICKISSKFLKTISIKFLIFWFLLPPPSLPPPLRISFRRWLSFPSILNVFSLSFSSKSFYSTKIWRIKGNHFIFYFYFYIYFIFYLFYILFILFLFYFILFLFFILFILFLYLFLYLFYFYFIFIFILFLFYFYLFLFYFYFIYYI